MASGGQLALHGAIEPQTDAMTGEQSPQGTVSNQLTSLRDTLGREQDGVSIGEIIDRLGQSAIGMTLLLFTLPVLIPLPGPFGILFGSVVAFVSLQLMFGARRLWLPDFIRNRRLGVATVHAMIDKGAPILRRVEGWLKPRRLLPLTGTIGRMALGAPLLVMGAAVALPIPLGNVPPVASLIMLSIGLMVRDGVAIIIGLVLSVIAVGWFVLLFYFGSEILAWLGRLVGWS